jgi:FkbM family methyltransferase
LTLLSNIKEVAKFSLRRVLHFFYPWTALNHLDRKLLKYLPQRNGVFIEAGANDGIRQSNTYFLEKRRGWTGVLVEPVPRLARRCRRTRRHSTVVETLLVPPEQSGSKLQLLDLDLMTAIADQPAILIDLERHATDAERVQRIRRVPMTAMGVTLSSLIDEHTTGHIDLLSLDVEGYEIEALRGLDLDRHHPSWILIETRAPEATNSLLSPAYEFVAALSHHDYLYRLR